MIDRFIFIWHDFLTLQENLHRFLYQNLNKNLPQTRKHENQLHIDFIMWLSCNFSFDCEISFHIFKLSVGIFLVFWILHKVVINM